MYQYCFSKLNLFDCFAIFPNNCRNHLSPAEGRVFHPAHLHPAKRGGLDSLVMKFHLTRRIIEPTCAQSFGIRPKTIETTRLGAIENEGGQILGTIFSKVRLMVKSRTVRQHCCRCGNIVAADWQHCCRCGNTIASHHRTPPTHHNRLPPIE